MMEFDWYATFSEVIALPISYLLSPSRRIFVGYLFSAGVIGFIVLRVAYGYTTRESLNRIFAKDNWWSTSARTDYGLFLIGLLVKFILVVPYLTVGSMLAWKLSGMLTACFGAFRNPLPAVAVALSYPIVLFLVKDFFVYLTHYYLHRNPYLWEFHKVHHSAIALNPFTLYRMHPIEILIQNIQGLTGFVLVTATYYYLNDSLVARATIWGVNGFSFIFFVAGANLRHSNLPFRYPHWLERWLMSPFQHQIHHGNRPQQCHRNFGSRLSIWDRWFGTLVYSSSVDPDSLCFGLPGKGLYQQNTILGNLISPFIGCKRRWANRYSIGQRKM